MDQLDEIRSKIDIVTFISEYLPLKKAGRNFKALCPFHQEKQPSFIVSPERQIWKCFGCFPAGQLIKTKWGLKLIEKVEKGDEVFTDRGRWRKVVRLLERDYAGDTVSIKVRKLGGEVILTGDHKVFAIGTKNCRHRGRKTRLCQDRCDRHCPTKYFADYEIEKVEARKLSKGDYLLYPLDESIKDIKEFNLKKFITRTLPLHGRKPREISYVVPVGQDFLKLLGYWIAEGSNHRAYIRFSLGDHEEDLAKEIQRIIKNLFGLKVGLHKRNPGNKTGLELTCCHSFLANIFENLCGKGAESKHIPFGFENLPPEKLKILVDAIFEGDGFINRRTYKKVRPGMRHITTVSSLLSVQLREALLRLGYEPSVIIKESYKDKNGVSHKKSYTTYWREDPRAHHTSFWKEKNQRFWLLPIREIQRRNFKGKVYNFTVKDDHSYVANNFVVANCGEGGDVFSFLMRMEGMEFGEALRTLAKRAGVKLISYRPTGREAEKEKLYAVNHLTSEFYHYLLVSHAVGKKALGYVLGRGITKDSIKNFKLGYAPSLWDGLQRFMIGKKGYRLEDLQNAGLISRVSGQARDFFRERIIFPLKDHRGNVVGFSGRVMPGKDESVPKYINIAETLAYQKGRLLYGLEKAKEKVKKEGKVIIVEGEFDVISSFQAGVENVVAIKGSALSQDQCGLLKRFGEEMILALDRDVAGDAAARRGIEIADSFGFDIKVVRLPEGKDPDQLAQKNPQAWKKAIEQAVPVYDFFIDSACSRFDKGSPSGKRKIGDEVLPVLKRITNDLVRAHYVKVLAEKLTLPEEALLAQMEKTSLPAEGRPSPQIKKEEKLSRRQLLEEYLLALAFQGKRPRQLLKRKISSLIQTPAYTRIIKPLRQYFKRRKKFSSESFVKSLPSELVEIFNSLFLKDLGEKVEDEDWLGKEVLRTIFELEKLDLGQKLKAVSFEIAYLEKEKKARKLKAKEEEFKKLSQRLSKLREVSVRG